jgi:hypothetical protein
VQLRSSLNHAWHVNPDPNAGGIRNFLAKRLLLFAMILGIGFLLLVSLTISAALVALGGFLAGFLPKGFSSELLHALSSVISFGIIATLFGAMFTVMPDVKIHMAAGVGRGGVYGRPVRGRQIRARPLSRQERYGQQLRRGLLHGRGIGQHHLPRPRDLAQRPQELHAPMDAGTVSGSCKQQGTKRNP